MSGQMTKVPLMEITTPSTAITKEAWTERVGADLFLRYEFDRDGRLFSSGIVFRKVRATQWRAEAHCGIWHLSDTYDTVCEVENSAWVLDLQTAGTHSARTEWNLRHFAIYLDSSGCFEVVSESCELLPDTAFDADER